MRPSVRYFAHRKCPLPKRPAGQERERTLYQSLPCPRPRSAATRDLDVARVEPCAEKNLAAPPKNDRKHDQADRKGTHTPPRSRQLRFNVRSKPPGRIDGQARLPVVHVQAASAGLA